MIRWDEEKNQFLIDNYQGRDTIELTKLFNEHFNLNASKGAIQMQKANLKRRRGINLNCNINRGKYRIGIEPANKGKKWDEYLSKEQQEKAKRTCFKKGNIPQNHKEVGSERISVDGFVEIKVAEPSKWQLKSRYLYEQYYNEKLTRNDVIIYLDGNKQNLDISNLKKISRAENLIMNHNNLRYNNKETTESAVVLAKMMKKAGLR